MTDNELLKDSDMDKIRAWLSVFSPDGYRESQYYLRGGGHAFVFNEEGELTSVHDIKINTHRTTPDHPFPRSLLGLTD